ncbi:hypothetical protein B0A52_01876 [Exophiala mesophila]|uniref:Fe2OG dioxygenase domain-containing protein n=1 Tax=Exophiala mesophila TaxID=212818 RepID=A0A438NE94_EXOME|nr:hypothetical protein B0A52_01876 [Exophiala mesophila]
MVEEGSIALPPSGPPPLLTEGQLVDLANQGWIKIELPTELGVNLTKLFQHSTSFFNQSNDVKTKEYPRSRGTEYGYYEVEGEKEYVTFRRHVHSDAHETKSAQFEQMTAVVWEESARILCRILCDVARASELDVSVWDDILDGTLSMPHSDRQMTNTLLRVFHYQPSSGHAEAHTDLGLLTLCIGDSHGLQVLDRDQSLDGRSVWIDAPATTGSATVLVSETLRMLSNGTMNTGIHRVVGNPNGRSSAVFALRHSSRHRVDLGLFGGEGKIHPNELYKAMEVGKVNINVVKPEMDRQYKVFHAEQGNRDVTGQG